jgi:hypothetical protein
LTKKILAPASIKRKKIRRGLEIFFAKPEGLELARWLGA